MTAPKTERNELIRKMRYEEKRTLQYIANEFGLTRERVRQIAPNLGKQKKGMKS